MSALGQSNGSKDKEVRAPAIPSEWKVELPEYGAAYDDTLSGCRSIEDGYERQSVLGQGTYGEVMRDARDRGGSCARVAWGREGNRRREPGMACGQHPPFPILGDLCPGLPRDGSVHWGYCGGQED